MLRASLGLEIHMGPPQDLAWPPGGAHDPPTYTPWFTGILAGDNTFYPGLHRNLPSHLWAPGLPLENNDNQNKNNNNRSI